MNFSPKTVIKAAQQSWRIQWLRRRGATLGPGAWVGSGVKVRLGWGLGGPGQVAIGPGGQLETGVVLDAYGGKIALDDRVFLGPYVVIYGHGGVMIGANSLVAMHCCILSSNHALSPFGVDIRSQPDSLRPTRIGRDVWLGARVTVLGGVTIGDGCIVGAGSVVTKDLPPGAIAFGTPCVVKKFRPGSP
jgi:acetyltransferase-like isoleucine patch superfamily enzyme